ncbi:MAG: Unknown protein, partial [uncultured Sulfurovum sp.]
MKNLAFLYSGKADGLLSLQHDCNAIQEILERHNAWEVKANRPLGSEKKLREDFENHKEIENLFIFYTGHAIGDGVVKNKLKLKLLDDDYDIQIFLDSILEVFPILPIRTVIVLDACYSGKFIYNAEKFDDSIEIVTSSLPHLKSSSNNPNSNLSLFTHYFCEAIEQLSLENKEVNFKNIIQYVNDNNEQKCIYSPPVYIENSEMILTKDRSLYLLLEELKAKFDSYPNMKDKVLEYVDARDTNFKEFIEAKSFSKLYSWLLKNKECLYCLFKEFKIDGSQFLESYTNDCERRKKKASQSQMITDVILTIKPSIGKKLDECRIEGWFKYNSNQYVPIALENKVMNFTNVKTEIESYMQIFPQELALQLDGQNYDRLKLNLILHESLFEIDFQNLKIKLNGQSEKYLIEEFYILTQFEYRYSNFSQEISQITRWKINSEKYEKNQETKIENLIYPLSKDKPS